MHAAFMQASYRPARQRDNPVETRNGGSGIGNRHFVLASAAL
jgi:hypothetical protein